jgi:serine/threonine protein phosphatase 1
MNLLRMFERSSPPAARFPDGRVGYAVGDIHGRADLLSQMLDMLEASAAADTREAVPVVVFLGDYVDRGPASAGVIELLLSGRPAGFERHYLKGNHEQSMLAFMDAPMANRAWLMQGGVETLLSYGVQPPSPVGTSEADWLAAGEALRAATPSAHLEFLNGLERFIAFGDYAFVHAGIDPARTLEDQTDEDLLWARDRFIASKRRFSHRVVHGHTPVDRPHADERRIAVDTGAYASGVLTAARFEGGDVTFHAVSDRGPVVQF